MKRIKLDADTAKLSEGVPILHEIPDELEFNAKYFEAKKPLLVRSAVTRWLALQKWTPQYLFKKVGHRTVNVDVRPKNFPKELVMDKLDNIHFCWPLQLSMSMQKLLRHLQDPEGNIYSTKCILQNNFPELCEHIDLNDLNFITNAWKSYVTFFSIEDGRLMQGLQSNSLESAHVVISGYKDFILIPASQQGLLPVRRFAQANFLENGENMYMERLLERAAIMKKNWIAVDPLKPDFLKFPEYKNCTPLEVRVNAGDVLYVPQGYVQHVRQSQGCITITMSHKATVCDEDAGAMEID